MLNKKEILSQELKNRLKEIAIDSLLLGAESALSYATGSIRRLCDERRKAKMLTVKSCVDSDDYKSLIDELKKSQSPGISNVKIVKGNDVFTNKGDDGIGPTATF